MKLRTKKPAPVEPDDEDVVEEKPRKKAKKFDLAKLPDKTAVSSIMGVGDLTDEEVEAEMEDAVNRASSFGYKLSTIREHLKSKNYQQVSLTTKEALLATMLELMPLAEQSLRQTKVSKGVYQFQAMINNIRELLIDLDGERDLNSMVLGIFDGVVKPPLMILAQMFIEFHASIDRQLKADLSSADAKIASQIVAQNVKALAAYIDAMSRDMESRLHKTLEQQE